MRKYIVRHMAKIMMRYERKHKDAEPMALLLLLDKHSGELINTHNFCCRACMVKTMLIALKKIAEQSDDEDGMRLIIREMTDDEFGENKTLH